MKALYDLLTFFFDVSSFPILNIIITFVIGVSAFLISFSLTNIIFFQFNPISSLFMSLIHWSIRLALTYSLMILSKGLIFLISQPFLFFNIENSLLISTVIVLFINVCFLIYVRFIRTINI